MLYPRFFRLFERSEVASGPLSCEVNLNHRVVGEGRFVKHRLVFSLSFDRNALNQGNYAFRQ